MHVALAQQVQWNGQKTTSNHLMETDMARVREQGDGPKCKCGKPAVWSGFCQMEDGHGYCDTAQKNPSLMQQLDDFDRLMSLLSDEDVSDQDDRVIAELEAIEANIKNKIDGYCDVIRKFKAWSTEAGHEAARYRKREDMWKRKHEMLKERLKQAMERLGEKKIVTPKNTVSICANGGMRSVKIIGDVPQEYLEVLTRPDTNLIRMALEHGDELPFAKLEERGTHIRL